MTYMSRYEYTLDDNGTLKKTTTPVMGFTASNYFENDKVHNLFLTDAQKKNYQTYDYDDFKYIAEAGYDTVRFDSKYCTGNTSNKTGHGTTLKDNLDSYTPASEYQDLVDFDGHKCSILRYCSEEKNIPDDVNDGKLVEGENNYLRIISTGNNDDKVGKWSTVWYVYAPDGAKITSGHPSDFVPRRDENKNILPDDKQTTAYQDVRSYMIDDISAAYFPAKISYEIEMEEGGFRSDGLWLFSNSDSKVKVSTKIIYTDTEKSNVTDDVLWNEDPYKEGTITGIFTGADVSVDGATSEDVYRNTEVQLSATNGNKYIFYGWAIKDSNGEYVMQTELSALSPYTVAVNTTLYAMYVQPDAGTLTLTNTRYTGAGAGIGTGSYYVSAVLYNKDDTLIKDYGRAEKSLIINDPVNFNSNTPKDAYFKVTLHTDPFGDSQFVNFYVPSREDGTLVSCDAMTDTAYDYEFNIPVDVLYDADGKQTTQVINSYSNLKLPTVDLKFTHDLYSHAQKNSYDDPAGDGIGSTEIQITVKNNNDVEIYSSQQTSRSITLLSSYLEQVISAILAGTAQLSDYTIYVTLTTTPGPNTKFITTYRKDYGTPTDTSPLNVSATNDNLWNSDVYIANHKAVYSTTLDEICTYADGTFKFKQNEINFYSDLDTVKIPYKINYKFTSRLYGEQTYAVDGNISMNSLNLLGNATNDYRLSEAFLTSSTPYETNYMKKLTWNYPEAQQSYTAEGGIVVNVNSTQTDIEVTATIKDGDKTYSVTTNYGEHFKLDGKFITASGDKFSYWEIRKVTDEFVCNNYSYQFNYVGYDDYIVTAVYDSSTSQADNINTTITDVNLSRNQWNVPGNSVKYPTADRIYVDFNLAYEYNGVKFNGDTLDKDVKLGYVIVAQRPDGNSVSAEELKNAIPSNTSSTSFQVNDTNVINKAIGVRDLDNKNRVAATYGIKNTPANRNLTFTAYSYMIVGSEITLSGSPIEFTIDDIGTK